MFEIVKVANGYELIGHAEQKGIDGAIEKWEMVVGFLQDNPTLDDGGGATCQLCHENRSCTHCPIAIYSGQKRCFDTPYFAWATNPCLETALEQLNFLYIVKGAQ